jgi:hypothetical protein
VTSTDAETFATVAVTCAVPAPADVSVAVETPFVVMRMLVVEPVSVKVPSVVVNCTAVPFGTFWLFSVTVAVMMTFEFTNGLVLDA